ncbi:DUF1566 domain-containing protein [bacterium]|jgi:hypothetical protein|nr:DUF1566 domain-containing protein [bacterium]
MKILKIIIFVSLLTCLNAQMVKQSESTLKDSKTNLLWQDTKEGTIIRRDFLEAQNYCQNLELDGYKNWQMPNFLELFSIVDTKSYNPTLPKEFKYFVSDNYWSSKTFGHGVSGEAFVVNFLSGAFNRELMVDKFYIRCVKDLSK